MLEYFIPVVFGTPAQTLAGIIRALADQDRRPAVRAVQGVSRLPRAVRGHRRHTRAMCQVAELLSAQLPVPRSVPDLFVHLTERWDGRGGPARLRGEAIPLAMRVIQVARDAAFHCMIGGASHAAGVVRSRAGHAFDPEVATLMADEADEILALEDGASAWDETLAAEPEPRPMMAGDEIDRALAAMGDFADLVSP
ncbi:MAG: HD domain-containing phosphohydrolase, partial [Actinomycetes bacterium]